MIFCVDYQHFVYEALRLPGNILSVSLLPVGLLVAVQSHLNSCRNGENYESSSQLLRVWFCSSGGVINVSVGKVQCETTTIIGFTTAEIFSILFLTLYDVISYH